MARLRTTIPTPVRPAATILIRPAIETNEDAEKRSPLRVFSRPVRIHSAIEDSQKGIRHDSRWAPLHYMRGEIP